MAKYGEKAQKLVETEMKAMKDGKLRSGSGAKVSNPKQAIAIALSEARREGVKLPPAPKGSAATEKPVTKKPGEKTAATKKVPAKASAKKASVERRS